MFKNGRQLSYKLIFALTFLFILAVEAIIFANKYVFHDKFLMININTLTNMSMIAKNRVKSTWTPLSNQETNQQASIWSSLTIKHQKY